MINFFHNFSDMFVVIIIISSLLITLLIPYIIKKYTENKPIRKYEFLTSLMLIFIFSLIINTSLKYHKYSAYYNQFPNQILLNKDTSFGGQDSILNKSCEEKKASLYCSIANYNYVFNDYYFDTASINIKSENAIKLLNNTNYKLEIVFYRDNYKQNILIDNYTLITSEDGYFYNIDLSLYLKDYHLKEYNFVYVTIDFIDTDTNHLIQIETDEFISNYEIKLSKYYNK